MAAAIVPLPTLILAASSGTAAVALSTALTAVMMAAFCGTYGAAVWIVVMGLPTAVAVWGLRKGVRIEGVVSGAVGALAAGIALLLLATFGSLEEVHAHLAAGWRDGFDGAIAVYRDLGMSADQLTDLSANRDEMVSGLIAVMPAMVIVAGGAIWLLNVWLANRWVSWPQASDFAKWQAPPALIWYLIATGFGMFFPIPEVALAAGNAFLVILACYFCQGLAIVTYFLHRFGVPRGVRMASYVLIALQQVVAGVVLALGLFDLWGDFRRLHPVDAPAEPDAD